MGVVVAIAVSQAMAAGLDVAREKAVTHAPGAAVGAAEDHTSTSFTAKSLMP